MAKTLRKKNFKIQMLAGNNLKSFPNANFQKTVTLILASNTSTQFEFKTLCIAGECCENVEVYNSIKNAFKSPEHEFLGTYIAMPEFINNQYHYQSTFDNGKHGIWWCGFEWQIGNIASNLLLLER